MSFEWSTKDVVLRTEETLRLGPFALSVFLSDGKAHWSVAAPDEPMGNFGGFIVACGACSSMETGKTAAIRMAQILMEALK